MVIFRNNKLTKEKINIINWADVNSIIFYTCDFEGKEIVNNAKLEVKEEEVAILVKNNKILNIYKSGRHPISMSIIKKIQEKEVNIYFTTTQLVPIIRWKTNDIRLKGKEFDLSGYYSFKIVDVETFANTMLINSETSIFEKDILSKIEKIISQCVCSILYNSQKSTEEYTSNEFKSLSLDTLKIVSKEILEAGIEISDLDIQIRLEEDNDFVPPQMLSFISKKKEEPQVTITKTDLQTKYSSIVMKCFNTIMQNKQKEEVFTLSDAENIVTTLLAVVKKDYKQIPPEIKVSCDLSLAIVAPSTIEKMQYIKSAVGIAGGLTGIGSILGALGMVLGWGTGILGAIKVFFVGVSLTGPIALAISGLTIAGIATYFAFNKKDNNTIAQKFKEALIKQVEKSVETTWNQYKNKFL